MAGVPFLLPFFQLTDDDGSVLVGGLVETYDAGTNTPRPLFTTAAMTVQHPFPLQADGAGRVMAYAEDRAYKVIVKRADGSVVRSEDSFRFPALSGGGSGSTAPDWLPTMTW